MTPVLLDTFCKAGGCSVGFHRAGFRVVGVDIEPQPNYPFEFHQADALDVLRDVAARVEPWPGAPCFDGFHASPPCEGYSTLAAMHRDREYPMLIEPVRELLQAIGKPYVIENVEGAPLALHPQLDGTWSVTLCGSMFGLGVDRGYLRRHRLFETNFPVRQPTCNHQGVAVGVYGHGGHSTKHRMLYAAEAREAMRIDWMSRDELAKAIPPAYTEHIGRCLMAEVERRAKLTPIAGQAA